MKATIDESEWDLRQIECATSLAKPNGPYVGFHVEKIHTDPFKRVIEQAEGDSQSSIVEPVELGRVPTFYTYDATLENSPASFNEAGMDDPELSDSFSNLSPSSSIVAKILETEGEMEQGELREQLNLNQN